ncbi:hypothetical protein AAFF_G00218960 [Aldrovandia affinis]|uniref:Uncharacterized protein n=1 Tax=Aldrovandia affinis TaxID=143900 RepID=A0AAD7SXA3_9TELE|nr:hypothetical protein AAFF_G00218960 [Aldrovandia affinis]
MSFVSLVQKFLFVKTVPLAFHIQPWLFLLSWRILFNSYLPAQRHKPLLVHALKLVNRTCWYRLVPGSGLKLGARKVCQSCGTKLSPQLQANQTGGC